MRLPVEHRAVTTGPTNVGTTEQPPVLPVFAAGVGAFLGADRPTVAAGLVAFPVLDQRPDVGGPHVDSTAVDETTGSFSSSLLTPGRIQASYFYKRVDAARFPVIDLALRQALNGGLEEKLDQELIAGTEGLLTGTNLANHAAAAVTTFAAYLSAFGHSRVDGRYAAALSDVRAVVGAPTYAHMGNQYRSNNADYSALDALDRKTGGVRVSAHVPAAASHKQNAVIRLGMHDRAVLQVLVGRRHIWCRTRSRRQKPGRSLSRRSCWSRRRSSGRRVSTSRKRSTRRRGTSCRYVLSPVPAAMRSGKMSTSRMRSQDRRRRD